MPLLIEGLSVSKVVILLSTYNGQLFLRDFMESLCMQQLQDFDVIVRDDGSIDETQSIIESYSHRLRINLLKEKNNLGPAKSFIRLLQSAGPSYSTYMFADQDDWWECDKISRCANHFERTDISIPTLYFSALELVDANLKHISFSRAPRKLSIHNALVENVATGCTIGINSSARSLILQSYPRDYTMHDWWIYLILTAFGDVYFDTKPTIKYRQHSSNSIGSASGFFEDYKRRILRFFKPKKSGIFLIAEQTNSFLECYGHMLTNDLKSELSLLLPCNKSLLNSIHLFFFTPFYRQKILDSLILRVMFFIRRY